MIRKRKRYEETISDPPTKCTTKFDGNETVIPKSQSKTGEATKIVENGSKQGYSSKPFKQLSLEESLQKIEKFYKSEEPVDPEEREKRRQKEAQIEEKMKILEDLIDSSVGGESLELKGLELVEDALKNLTIDPSFQV